MTFRGIECAGSGEAAPPRIKGLRPEHTFTGCLTVPPHRLRRRSADGGGSARTRGVGAGRSGCAERNQRLAPGGRAALPLTRMRPITRISLNPRDLVHLDPSAERDWRADGEKAYSPTKRWQFPMVGQT